MAKSPSHQPQERAARTNAERQAAELERQKRGPGSNRRWVLHGAAITAGLVVVLAAGWWGLEQWRMRTSFGDASLTVLESSAEQALKPKDTFKECDHCPEMVVVPAGSFVMGSAQYDDEQPPHKVTIAKPFAVGKFAVTFDEWDACVTAGACNHFKPNDETWGRGSRPVINVSWSDADAYVTWLSAKTGQDYRLMTEAEWEYAARAGTTTKYSWGDDIGMGNANCQGCGSQWDSRQTAPVGSFKPNPFGLYDMYGNVWQWTRDCWHDSYDAAPTQGSAWFRSCTDTSNRVVRGGSWHNVPRYLRSTFRGSNSTDFRNNDMGFRVGRTLGP